MELITDRIKQFLDCDSSGSFDDKLHEYLDNGKKVILTRQCTPAGDKSVFTVKIEIVYTTKIEGAADLKLEKEEYETNQYSKPRDAGAEALRILHVFVAGPIETERKKARDALREKDDLKTVINASGGRALKAVIIGMHRNEILGCSDHQMIEVIKIDLKTAEDPIEVTKRDFNEQKEAKKFREDAMKHGLSAAATLSKPGMQADASFDVNSDSSKKVNSESKSGVTYSEEINKNPVKSFQFTRSDICAAESAVLQAANVSSMTEAYQYLLTFGTHVPLCLQTLGFMTSTYSENKTESNTSSLIASKNSTANASATVSVATIFNSSVKRTSEKSSNINNNSAYDKTQNEFRSVTLGSATDLRVIDRGDTLNNNNLLPVWELILSACENPKYVSLRSELVRASQILFAEWVRLCTRNHIHNQFAMVMHTVIQFLEMTVSPNGVLRDQDGLFVFLRYTDETKGSCYCVYDGVEKCIIVYENIYSVYYGNVTLVDGQLKRHGKGRFVMSVKLDNKFAYDVYDGYWLNDQRHGKGYQVCADGETYDGYYRYDKRHGIGKEFKKGELSLFGQWEENRCIQFPLKCKPDKFKIIQYKKDLAKISPVAFYHHQFENGDTYIGQLNQKRQKDGKGAYFTLNGKGYEGKWKDDLPDKSGDSESYEVHFRFGIPYGLVTHYRNGVVNFFLWNGTVCRPFPINPDGVPETIEGVSVIPVTKKLKVIEEQQFYYYTFDNGDIYIGQLNQKKEKHGQGFYIDNNGQGCKGVWHEDQIKGETVPLDFHVDNDVRRVTFPNGDVYEGEWLFLKRHGQGKLTDCNDKVIFEGQWENDEPVSIKDLKEFELPHPPINVGVPHSPESLKVTPHSPESPKVTYRIILEGTKIEDVKGGGKGNFNLGNGSSYNGEVLDGKRHGQGEFISNEDRYIGRWAHDKREGFGTQFYSDGDKYEGHWKNDLMHGLGAFTFYNKRGIYGTFEFGTNPGL